MSLGVLVMDEAFSFDVVKLELSDGAVVVHGRYRGPMPVTWLPARYQFVLYGNDGRQVLAWRTFFRGGHWSKGDITLKTPFTMSEESNAVSGFGASA
jgi:hypothetical protein